VCVCVIVCLFLCKCYVCVGETGLVGEKEWWHMGMSLSIHLSIMWVGEAGWGGAESGGM
jgi:predicted small integral membrane protein